MIKTLYAILRRGLLCLTGAAIIQTAHAEFRYTFTQTTGTYTALSSPTSVNANKVWDDEIYNIPTPFAWVLDSADTMNRVWLNLSLPAIVNDNVTSTPTGFALGGLADFRDRGFSTNTTVSPMSIQTTGTTPNRIFKLELQNVGFANDAANTDYLNLQIWIYETSNIVEYHFGSSSVTATADRFATGLGPVIGLAQKADVTGFSSGSVYYVSDNGTATSIDTLRLPPLSGLPTNLLADWPADGTVFRFTPKWSTCSKPAASFTSLSQSALSVQFTFTAATTGLDSLVWNFGDGQRQKVSAAFTAPVTHTYTTAGQYGATVTSYNSCGSTTSTASQVKVAIAGIPGLSGVRVFPNITSESIMVEGLSTGSTVAVFNTMGQQLRRFTTSESRQAISLGGLPAGSYLLRMTDKNGSQGTAPVTKQ